jgi:FAD/FMN-containing dehydrogenase
VVKPAHVADVVTVIQFARRIGWQVASRGTGHSQGGQSQCKDGLVIDTRNLNRIVALNLADGWVIAEAGMLWGDLVRAVVGYGLMPPVLTDNLAVTIGGTLSVGGVGPASFKAGLQVDHCLGLEVVLGTGEVAWLSPEHEPELFQHVLAGLGGFGLITKAKLRLRPFRPLTASVYLSYGSLEAFLSDASLLMQRDQIWLLEGAARPLMGLRHRYVLEVSVEAAEAAEVDRHQLSQGLKPEVISPLVEWPTPAHLFRLEKRFEGYRHPVALGYAHPWVEHYLPSEVVAAYVDTIAAWFPATPFLLWPMQREALRLPTFALPDTPEVVLVGIMASMPANQSGELLPLLQRASSLGIDLGGKRYLSGWLSFSQAEWQSHYGAVRWQRLLMLKQQFDPDHILQALPFEGGNRHV